MSLFSGIRSRLEKSYMDYYAFRELYAVGARDLLPKISKCQPIDSFSRQEILKFWKPYCKGFYANRSWDIRWFDIYNRTNVFGFDLRRYIPDSYYFYVIDRYLNQSQAAAALDDKNLYDLYFHDVPQPKTICRKEGDVFLDAAYNIIDENVAIRLCKDVGKVILKPSVATCAGAGISVWNADKNTEEELHNMMTARPYFVVQEFLTQSPALSQFNASTVNTMRIVTLLFQGEIHVVTAVLICGGKDAVTNHLHAGGICCGIHSDGHLFHTAFDGKLNPYKVHPNGAVFADCVIPNYQQCTDLVKSIAPRLCHTSRMISWDVTLDEHSQPVLIEANLRWGGSVQIAGGPVFGDMTEDVLKEIVSKKQ